MSRRTLSVSRTNRRSKPKRAVSRTYRSTTAPRLQEMTARQRALWICYRITEEEYDAILIYQRGVCAGCGRPPNGIRLAVDHCHKTGRIRGLLCWLCNRAIGILRDNATAAANLGNYLKTPTAPLALGKETYGLIGQAKASKKIKIYGPPDTAVVRRKHV